ncbi:MAG: hypothetical protein QXI33_03560 [Candidatus Pacearchaeota archaeon]
MDLIKITPDSEKVKSILRMAALLEERIKNQDPKKMFSLIISDYYEIIKELLTAVLLVDGWKTLSHKDLIDYLGQNYGDFNKHEISKLDSLRSIRNKIAYEGFFASFEYLQTNEVFFKDIITKLKKIINIKISK